MNHADEFHEQRKAHKSYKVSATDAARSMKRVQDLDSDSV